MGMFLQRGTAPSLGTPIGDLDVGSIVKLNVDGTPWEFLIVHQGLPGGSYDESCDGTWLLMKDCYENRAWNNSDSNNLEDSTIHIYLNSIFLSLFDVYINNTIKQVKIPYRKGGGSGGIAQNGANGLPCKVFLLSGPEVGLSGESGISNDGEKLDYFNENTGNDAKRIAYMNGNAGYWWLRSMSITSSTVSSAVSPSGGGSGLYSSGSHYIRPALVLPPEVRAAQM